MKEFMAFLFLFASVVFTAGATSLPACDSSEFRLGALERFCAGHFPPKLDFPGLGLQRSDLDKILLGSESSGGRELPDLLNRPMGGMRMQSFTHRCELRFLIDAGKRVSWLMQTTVDVVQSEGAGITAEAWNSGLILGDDIMAEMTPVTERPKYDLNGVGLLLTEDHLKLCYDQSCAKTTGESVQLEVLKDHLRLEFWASCQSL